MFRSTVTFRQLFTVVHFEAKHRCEYHNELPDLTEVPKLSKLKSTQHLNDSPQNRKQDIEGSRFQVDEWKIKFKEEMLGCAIHQKDDKYNII